jgi:hypothetical protein
MKCKKCGKKYKIRDLGIPSIKFPDSNYNNYIDFIEQMRFKGNPVINSDIEERARILLVKYNNHISSIIDNISKGDNNENSK